MSTCPYGVNKQGKPNNAGNWKWITSLRVNTAHKGDSAAQKKAYLEAHKQLKQKIGEELYNKDFRSDDKYINLNNAETQVGAGIYHSANPTKRAGTSDPQAGPSKAAKTDTSGFTEVPEDFFDDIHIAEATPPGSPQSIASSQNTTIPETPSKEMSAGAGSSGAAPVAMDTQESGIGSQSGAAAANGETVGSGGGSGSATTARHIVLSGGQIINPYDRVIQNSFRIKTWGNALFEQHRTVAGSNLTQPLHTWPQAVLPTQALWFYMSPAQFKQIWDNGSQEHYVKEVRVKVTPVGPTVNFNTNEGASGTAAPSHIIYGRATIGLNKILPCDMVDIERDAAKPMELISATNNFSPDEWIHRIWGYSNLLSIANTNIQTAANGQIIIPHTYLRIWQPPKITTIGGATNTAGVAGTNRVICSDYPMDKIIPVMTMKHFETANMPILDFQWEVKRPYNLGDRTQIYDNTPLRGSVTANRLHIWERYSTTQNSAKTYLAQTANNPTIVDDVRAQSAINPRFIIDSMKSVVNQTNYMEVYRRATIENMALDVNDKQQTKALGSVAHMPMVTFGIDGVQANVPGGVDSYINVAYDFIIETFIGIDSSEKDTYFNWPQLNPPVGTGDATFAPRSYPIHKYHGAINELAPLFSGWSTGASSSSGGFAWNTPGHMGLVQGANTLNATFTSFPQQGTVTFSNKETDDTTDDTVQFRSPIPKSRLTPKLKHM